VVSYLAIRGSRLAEVHTVSWITPSVGGGDHLRAYRADWAWFDARAPERPLSARLDGVIALDGFDLTPGATLRTSSPLTLTLYWRSVEPAGRLHVFVHLLDASGKIAAQHDGEPVGSLWPTQLWRTGDVVRDECVLALAPSLAPGQYTLKVGMYNAQTGTRLMTADGQDAVILGMVEATR
jgi:hypothetical protein